MTTTKERRCFIISAFGRDDAPPGSELRLAWERASAVITALIGPAIERANETIFARGEPPLTYHRGDYTRDTRPIIDDIHHNILNATINIAVLVTRNENVGYEIGVAKTFGRPVILLRHESYVPPYDLAHLRMVLFKDAAFEDGAHREQVLQILADTILLQVPDKHSPNFEPSLLGGDSVPLARCIAYDRFRFEYTRWDEHFFDTDREIWLAGISLDQLAGVRKFRRPVTEEDFEDGLEPFVDGVQQYLFTGMVEALLAQCRAGRDVNVLIMHEDSAALPELLVHPGRELEDQLPTVRLEIANTTRRVMAGMEALAHYAQQSGERVGSFRFTKVRQGLLTNRVSMVDHQAYVTPMFFTLDVNSGPCFLVAPLSPAEAAHRKGEPHGEIEMFGTVRADMAFLQRINPTLRLHPDGTLSGDLTPQAGRASGSPRAA